MIRRALVAFTVLAALACERQPTAPSGTGELAALLVKASDGGPPAPHAFGPDSRDVGSNTGAEHQDANFSCGAASPAGWSCSGYLASDVDATRLDATVQVPAGTGARPLIVLLHGWAGSKSGDSDIARSLLAEGYTVLRYSARGFGDSWGRVNLYDVGVELGDLRSVIGQVVEQVVDENGARAIDADAVAITGASYGGGQSWLAALQPRFRRSAGGPDIRIRTIVPIVPWSDLLYSLVPNGRPRTSVDRPGALKLSYVNALYFSGRREPGDGPQPWYDNYPVYLRAWHATLTAAEPTANLLYPQIRDGLAGYRSVWWQESFWTAVATSPEPLPVFVVQGLTDDLFTLEEAKRMLLAIQAVNPTYPIAAYFGDIGHPRARNNPDEVEYALGLIRAWLAFYLKGQGAQPPFEIKAAITQPRGLPFNPNVITAPTFDALATGVVRRKFKDDAVLVNPVSGAGAGCEDPVLQTGLVATGELREHLVPPPDCIDPSAKAYEVTAGSLTGGVPLLIAGQPTLAVNASTTGARVQLNVRLYDVWPGGTRRELITRGTYTIDGGIDAPLGTVDVTIVTQGNVWQVPPDHVLRLEVSNVDAPYIAPSQIPSVTRISKVELSIPVR